MRKMMTALAITLGLSTLTLAARPADACGGYVHRTEADDAQMALRTFLGELGNRVTIGRPTVDDAQAVAMIEYDAAGQRGRRVKVRQVYRLAKRDGAWQVVDWELPLPHRASPAPTIARR